jgi:hypothetical protein
MVFCIILGLLNIALSLNTQLFTYMNVLICSTKDALLQVLWVGFSRLIGTKLPFTRDYPQIWVQQEAKQIFLTQLDILKAWCHEKNVGANQVYISHLIDESKLETKVSFFKLAMIDNSMASMKPPVDFSWCSKMWALLITNQIICHKLSKWLKLVKLSMAVGSRQCKKWEMFFYVVCYEEHIEKLTNYPFESCHVDVCTKLLYYGNLPIYYNYQSWN